MRSLQLQRSEAEGFRQRRASSQAILHQMSDDFAVRLRAYDVPGLLKPAFQAQIVFHDAVVRHRHVASAVGVGVGVRLVDHAVGRPPRMSDANRALRFPSPDGLRQNAQLPRTAPDVNAAIGSHDGQARTVIAPVLQSSQSVHENGRSPAGATVPHDPAHRRHSSAGPISAVSNSVCNHSQWRRIATTSNG